MIFKLLIFEIYYWWGKQQLLLKQKLKLMLNQNLLKKLKRRSNLVKNRWQKKIKLKKKIEQIENILEVKEKQLKRDLNLHGEHYVKD